MGKTEPEIANLTQAARLTVEAYNQIVRQLRAGKFKTEKDIKSFLQNFARKNKTKLAFPPIISCGENTKNPHHLPSNKKLTEGFLMIDFGIVFKRYCSDMTRMLYLGKPSRKEKQLYNLLLKVQKKAIEDLRLNQKTTEIEKKVRKSLGKYSSYFIHSLGHGVGTKIHELPHFGLKSEDTIQYNQVFTIEPGIYFKNFGLRIEDTIWMKKKPIILTKASKGLVVVR